MKTQTAYFSIGLPGPRRLCAFRFLCQLFLLDNLWHFVYGLLRLPAPRAVKERFAGVLSNSVNLKIDPHRTSQNSGLRLPISATLCHKLNLVLQSSGSSACCPPSICRVRNDRIKCPSAISFHIPKRFAFIAEAPANRTKNWWTFWVVFSSTTITVLRQIIPRSQHEN